MRYPDDDIPCLLDYMERFKVAFISGFKAFVISGVSAVGVLLATGVQTTDIDRLWLAVLIAFVAGGIKGLEKAFNFKPL